jgi:undecaprenyl-diphosphatase
MKWILGLDASLSARLRIAEKPGILRSLAAVLAHSGDSWFWGAAMICVWLAGDGFWKRWSLSILLAISVLAALVLALKFAIRRRRPEGEWGGIYRNTDPHSFPSGHAARAFLIAVMVGGMGPAGLAFGLWIWAPLVSLARVAMGVHYLSDVAAGLILGSIAGFAALALQGPLLAQLSTLINIPLW